VIESVRPETLRPFVGLRTGRSALGGRSATGLNGDVGLLLEGEEMMKSDKKTPKDDADKSKAIDLAVAQIEKQFGQGSIMRLGDESAILPVESIPTGSLSLDIALGVGGVPRGRVIEVYGPEGSGKTTLTSSIIARAQKRGGTCAFVDAEHAFDVTYAKKIGVDVENLLISQPDTGEQALEIVEVLVRSGALDVVVVDSVAALVPAAELNGDMGDAHVGLQARLMSQALRKLAGVVAKSRTSLIFTNQIRMKIGVLFGSPETTSGGNALKFYSTVRMDIRRIGALKEGDVVSGNRTKVKVVKNKVAPPFRIAEFDILYGEGISYEGDILDIGAGIDVIKKSGTWYSYGDERLGQGKEAARSFLKSNPEIRDEVDRKIRAHFGIGPAAGAAGDGAAKAPSDSPKQETAEKATVPPTVAARKSRTGARATKK
jgi:recombination protein RecA